MSSCKLHMPVCQVKKLPGMSLECCAAGRITGDVRVNGHPWQSTTYARLSGYVEQTDIHSAKVSCCVLGYPVILSLQPYLLCSLQLFCWARPLNQVRGFGSVQVKLRVVPHHKLMSSTGDCA